jgi:hypothetical protein
MPAIIRNIKFQFSSGGIEASNTTQAPTGIDPHTDSVRAFKNTQSVGTAAEDVALLDIDLANQHIVMLTNKDATNFVTIYDRKDATPTDVTTAVIYPGESYGPVRRIAQTAGYPKLRMLADTASCNVEVVACEAKRA